MNQAILSKDQYSYENTYGFLNSDNSDGSSSDSSVDYESDIKIYHRRNQST